MRAFHLGRIPFFEERGKKKKHLTCPKRKGGFLTDRRVLRGRKEIVLPLGEERDFLSRSLGEPVF